MVFGLNVLCWTRLLFKLLGHAEFYARPSGTSNFAMLVKSPNWH